MSRWPTPGVFEEVASPPPPLPVVRDDIAAFIGLTMRGPLDHAIRVETWEEFRAHFGERSDVFLTPDAACGFFLNGGRACYVVRVAHRTPVGTETAADVAQAASAPCKALALGTPAGPNPKLIAAQTGLVDPGLWGNGVAVATHFTLRDLWPPPVVISATQMRLSSAGGIGRSQLAAGDLIWSQDAPDKLAPVISVAPSDPLTMGSQWGTTPTVLVTLGRPILTAGQPLSIVEATLDILTEDGRREHYEHLGLDWRSPRYLPSVLAVSSLLLLLDDVQPTTLYPQGLYLGQGAPPPADNLAVVGLSGGQDGVRVVRRSDFFDPDPDDEHPDLNLGLQQLDQFNDVSLVMMPDLALPADPPAPPIPVPAALPPLRKRTRFICSPPVPPVVAVPDAPPPTDIPVNLLDPDVVGGWDDLTQAENSLVAYCTSMGDRVALLSPPPSLDPRRAILWRARFDSAFAAAYYPWLQFGDAVAYPPLREVPPVGAAAGIIARSEVTMGVGRAPANLPAVAAAGLARKVSPDDWALLHDASFDVFRQLPDDVRLLGARTLSSDLSFRYLHVRRLLTHIERVLQRRMTWVVFEPHTPTLWSRVIRDVDLHVLRPLYEQRAFAGATTKDSYFIKCDATLNPPEQRKLGQLVCRIGVAPNIPAEYIVFRLAASPDRGLSLQEEG